MARPKIDELYYPYNLIRKRNRQAKNDRRLAKKRKKIVEIAKRVKNPDLFDL